MHSVNRWRMLPPGGAPLGAGAMVRGCLAARQEEKALDAFSLMVKQRFAMDHVMLAGSGRGALSLLLSALRRQRPDRDQALIPAYVSFSVPSAVVHAGCKVALYDVDPATLAPDWESLAEAVGRRTLAVVICHQFGLPCDPAPITALCRDEGAVLVDDAAQAMGASVNGRQAGCFGDAGIFSFSRGKPMTAVEGGVLGANRPDIAEAVAAYAATHPEPRQSRLLPVKALALSVLRRPEIYRLPASLPQLGIGASTFDTNFVSAAFSPFQAGIAAHAFRRLDAVNGARVEKAAQYRRALANMASLRMAEEAPGAWPIYLRFPLMPAPGAERERCPRQAEARALGISPGFPLPLNAIAALQPHLATHGREFPGARDLAAHLVTLPTHDHVREKDITAIVNYLSNSPPTRQYTGGMRA